MKALDWILDLLEVIGERVYIFAYLLLEQIGRYF